MLLEPDFSFPLFGSSPCDRSVTSAATPIEIATRRASISPRAQQPSKLTFSSPKTISSEARTLDTNNINNTSHDSHSMPSTGPHAGLKVDRFLQDFTTHLHPRNSLISSILWFRPPRVPPDLGRDHFFRRGYSGTSCFLLSRFKIPPNNAAVKIVSATIAFTTCGFLHLHYSHPRVSGAPQPVSIFDKICLRATQGGRLAEASDVLLHLSQWLLTRRGTLGECQACFISSWNPAGFSVPRSMVGNRVTPVPAARSPPPPPLPP